MIHKTKCTPRLQWSYNEFMSIKPSTKTGAVVGEFQIATRSGRKSDTMRFSSEYSPEILTAALEFHSRFGGGNSANRRLVKCRFNYF